MGWKTLDDMDLNGKRVLVRVDINVPVVDGVVTDATRIERIVPTVKDILAAGGKPILLAHFGRPGGERRQNLSLKQLVPTLEAAFGTTVRFGDDCVGIEAEKPPPQIWPLAKSFCSKTPDFTRQKRPKTASDLAKGMAKMGDMSTAMTHSPPRTARIARPKHWRACYLPVPDA